MLFIVARLCFTRFLSSLPPALRLACACSCADRHPVFIDRSKVLAAEREDKKHNAEAVREWSITAARQLCEYTVFAADKVFEVGWFTSNLCC